MRTMQSKNEFHQPWAVLAVPQSINGRGSVIKLCTQYVCDCVE